MLTEEQLKWCGQKTGYIYTRELPPSYSIGMAFDFLALLAKNYAHVELDINRVRFSIYCMNKQGIGFTIEHAVEDLVNKLCPTPDPDPYLVAHLIDVLAPGVYPTYADKVAAAEAYSRAEADGRENEY